MLIKDYFFYFLYFSTYTDVCALLAKIECPKEIIDHGFRCQCPFAAKEFNIPAGTTVAIPSLPIPSSLENVSCYHIRICYNKKDKSRLKKSNADER